MEDDRLNREMIAIYLSNAGYKVATACDGGEALALARAIAPDLVLLDMGLPVLDGWDAARAMRDLPALAAVPIIALTAYAMEGDRDRCLEAGCNDYCSKPIDFGELFAKIASLLGSTPAVTLRSA